jgi:CrcB protein
MPPDTTGTVASIPRSARSSSTRHAGLHAAVFAGGVVGALARTGLERLLPAGHGWPWATFAVNVGGAALLGWLLTRLQERLPPTTFRRAFAGTGVCGALTTFSTLQLEVLQLGRHGRIGLAAAYLAASVAAGGLALYLATALTRRVSLR